MLRRLTAPTPAAAYLLLTLTMLFWAGNFVVGRWAAGQVPPISLAFLRWSGAAALILAVAWRALAADWHVLRAEAGSVLLLGVIGSGLFNTLQYLALTETTAVNASILQSAGPALIALAGFLIHRERPAAGALLGIGVSLAGVLVVVAQGSWQSLARLSLNRGDFVMLAAMAIWALYTVLLARRPAMDPLAFAAATYLVAALVNLPLAAGELLLGARIVHSPAAWLAIAYTAVFPSFLAYLFFNRGVEIVGATKAGTTMNLVPLFASVLAMAVLGEQPALYHAVGFALILAGVWLATRWR
jgi:drug/metabolite transporter (DMT)-like permease